MPCCSDSPEPLAKRTRRLLAELGHRPRRSRGQSFLIDPTVAKRIVAIVTGKQRPKVLEVGAGLGALTDGLARQSSNVVAVELEEGFAAALQSMYAAQPQVRVVQADALKADFAQLCEGDAGSWRVVGNLPYYAASAMLLRLLRVWPAFERVVVTVQREVGERLLASPGQSDYGSLSVLASYYAEHSETVARVPRGAFYPQPKVDSIVVLIEPRRERPAGIRSEALLFASIRAGFGHRRKQLANALRSAEMMGPLDREMARQVLARAGVAEQARAQELALDDFIRVSNALWESGVRPVVAQ